jgi:murein tripeptide amidase MpaA
MKLVAATLLLVQVLLVAATSNDGFVHYDDHAVLRFNITTEQEAKLISDMNLDVWSHDSAIVFGINEIMVNHAQLMELAAHGLFHESVMIADVEAVLREERASLKKLADAPLASWYDTYHNLTEIFTHYQDLVKQYADVASWIPSIGKSIEGRDIPAVIFGASGAKKRIYYEGGQHAREWIGHATVAYITEQLLSNSTAKDLLANIQFVVVPVVNVDGYVFTWNSNRLWRKNRRQNTGGTFGVDLNRNWNDHFGGSGSSNTPSSDTYHGVAPFSEPETKAASDFYTKYKPYAGAIDFHSYSQLILRPYGWTKDLPPNDATAKTVGDGIRDKIKSVHNVQYTSEASWELYYTAGTAQDWFYAEGQAPLAYTIELRDTGTYGFQLPASQIIPTGEENWVAFQYFAQYILEH